MAPLTPLPRHLSASTALYSSGWSLSWWWRRRWRHWGLWRHGAYDDDDDDDGDDDDGDDDGGGGGGGGFGGCVKHGVVMFNVVHDMMSCWW